MEWNSIEKKWYEMARRLQNMAPLARQQTEEANSAVSTPLPKSNSIITPVDADEISARSTV